MPVRKKKEIPRGPTLEKVLRAANIVYLLSLLIVLIGDPFTLFSLHPIVMSLYWMLLSEGIIAQKQKNYAKHRLLMIITGIFVFIGFSIMYQVKESKGKEHFTTSHGFYGSMVATVVLGQVFGGLLFAKKNPLIGKIHKFCGYIAAMGTWFVGFLHMLHTSGWFMSHRTVQSIDTIMALGRVSYLMAGVFLIFVSMGK